MHVRVKSTLDIRLLVLNISEQRIKDNCSKMKQNKVLPWFYLLQSVPSLCQFLCCKFQKWGVAAVVGFLFTRVTQRLFPPNQQCVSLPSQSSYLRDSWSCPQDIVSPKWRSYGTIVTICQSISKLINIRFVSRFCCKKFLLGVSTFLSPHYWHECIKVTWHCPISYMTLSQK